MVALFALVALFAVGSPAASSASTRFGQLLPAAPSISATAFRIGTLSWGNTISYNPYSAGAVPFAFQGFAELGLAAVPDNPPNESQPFYPEMASSWQTHGRTVTLNLRRGATWQNGRPFTSRDVLISLLLAGATLNSAWTGLLSVSAKGAHQVVLTLQPWAVARNVLTSLFQINIVPASQYAKLATPGLMADILSYWKTYDVLHPTSQSIDAANSGSAGKALTKVSTALYKFAPKNLLGDGPFKLISAGENGVLYQKWPGFWDARTIHMPWVQIEPMTTATQFGALLSGRIDAETDTAFTDPERTKLNSTGHSVYYTAHEPLQVVGLVLHLADYPFGMLAVRKALEYVIDRPKLTKLDMGGTFAQHPPQLTPDGISDAMADRYMTKKQFASLNHYSYDPGKATSLLKGAGFTKKNGKWYMPNGKPFKLAIDEEAGFSLFDEDGIVISQMLRNFGIDASTIDINAASYVGQQEAGDFPVSEEWMDWGVGSPLADFASTFFTPAGSSSGTWNYPPSYNGGKYKYPVAIGIGPTANVPGLGKVNIASALNREINTAKPSQWANLTWDWARWMNQQLPFLPVDNDATQMTFSTTRYTDWTPKSKVWMWLIMPYLADDFVFMMQHGLLRLRANQ